MWLIKFLVGGTICCFLSRLVTRWWIATYTILCRYDAIYNRSVPLIVSPRMSLHLKQLFNHLFKSALFKSRKWCGPPSPWRGQAKINIFQRDVVREELQYYYMCGLSPRWEGGCNNQNIQLMAGGWYRHNTPVPPRKTLHSRPISHMSTSYKAHWPLSFTYLTSLASILDKSMFLLSFCAAKLFSQMFWWSWWHDSVFHVNVTGMSNVHWAVIKNSISSQAVPPASLNPRGILHVSRWARIKSPACWPIRKKLSKSMDSGRGIWNCPYPKALIGQELKIFSSVGNEGRRTNVFGNLSAWLGCKWGRNKLLSLEHKRHTPHWTYLSCLSWYCV